MVAISSGAKKNNHYPGLLLILFLYLALAGTYSWVVPLEEGPDEIAHFDYTRFIATQGHLPATLSERAEAGYKSDLPPLYHLLASIPARWVQTDGPPQLKRFEDTIRHRLVEHQRDILNLEDERQWPGQGDYLIWRLGRWVSIFFGAGVIWVTWLTAQRFFPEMPGLALGAAAVAGFIPRFTLSGAMLNYETLQAFLSALFLWLLLKLITEIVQAQDSPRKLAGLALSLGVVMGLALTTKYSTILLPLGAGAGLWLAGRQRPGAWRSLSLYLGLIILAGLLAAGWWFGFVMWRFNEVDRLGWVPGLLKPLLGTDSSDTTSTLLMSWLTGTEPGSAFLADPGVRESPWRWLYFFYHSFWVVDTGNNGLPLPLFLLVAGLLCLLALAGLWRWWWRSRGLERLQLTILLLHAALFLPLPLFRFLVTGNVADTSQGRHWLFPAASAIAILFVGGVRKMTPVQRQRWVGPVLALWLLSWNLFQGWVATWGYDPPLPVQTVPIAAAQAQQPLAVEFAGTLKLVGYSPPVISREIALTLELIWQATALMPLDYLFEVSLVDQAGDVAGQWLGHPLRGRYPTRAWSPGDIVRETVHLPLIGVAPGSYLLRVRVVTPSGSPVTPEEGFILEEITLEKNAFQAWEEDRRIGPEVASTGGTATSQADSAGLFRVIGQSLIGPFPPAPVPLLTVSSMGLAWWHPEGPQPSHYRETILFVARPQPGQAPLELWLVGPGEQVWPPERVVGPNYLFIVGARWASGDYRLRVKQGVLIQEDPTFRLAVVNPWKREFTVPAIPSPLEANFAGQFKLLGYDLPQRQVKPGGSLPVILYWQALGEAPQADFIQFNHLLDGTGSLYGGYDRLPLEDYSTLLWAPGEVVVDGYTIPVAAEAPPGEYYLNVGYYFALGESLIYLPLMVEGQMTETTSVSIGPIEVVAP